MNSMYRCSELSGHCSMHVFCYLLMAFVQPKPKEGIQNRSYLITSQWPDWKFQDVRSKQLRGMSRVEFCSLDDSRSNSQLTCRELHMRARWVVEPGVMLRCVGLGGWNGRASDGFVC